MCANTTSLQCVICGEPLTGRKRKFCGERSCYRKDERDRIAAYVVAKAASGGWIKACIVCGREYQAARQWHRYCGSDCQAEAKRQRDADRLARRERPCVVCGEPFAGPPDQQSCSRKCGYKVSAAKRRVHADEGTLKAKRRAAERAAGGLNSRQMGRLLHRWRKQGRCCLFCGGPCDTIEHLIPITRGGTSHEGNLAPCCRPCNASKQARLLIEWKRRPKVFVTWPCAAPRIVFKDWQQHRDCPICGARYMPARPAQKTCGDKACVRAAINASGSATRASQPPKPQRTCIGPDCERRAISRGLCAAHGRQRDKGDPLTSLRSWARRTGQCNTAGCDRPVYCRGLCSPCYGAVSQGKAPWVPTDRHCLGCGMVFAPQRPEHRHCTEGCYQQHYKRVKRQGEDWTQCLDRLTVVESSTT